MTNNNKCYSIKFSIDLVGTWSAILTASALNPKPVFILPSMKTRSIASPMHSNFIELFNDDYEKKKYHSLFLSTYLYCCCLLV